MVKQKTMRKGCLISVGILGLLMIIFIYEFSNLYDTEYEKIEIQQKIGGTLICNSELLNDIHDWQYNVGYSYKSKDGKLFNLGYGKYYAREWFKNEQLVKYDKWFILKTGDSYGTDKVIVGNFENLNWKDYNFTPDKIVKEVLWQKTNAKPLLDYCCAECFVTKINNGIIEVKYKFRIEENKTDLMDERILIYKINKETGEPNLINIKIK